VLGGVVGGVLSKPATTAATAKPGVQVLTFRIALRMDDGRRLNVHQAQLASGLRAGSRIRVVNGRVVASRPNP
jgi:outer membrane lipoprotein SlyB